MDHLELHILGSNSAIPLSNRSPSAQFLSIANQHFLIDCGEGTQVKLRKHKIGFGRIDHILISHLHGDHFYGLVPLLTTLHLLDRRKELHIYGPAELEEAVMHLLSFSGSRLRYPLVFHRLNPNKKGLVWENERIQVHSFPVKHSIDCWGFLFEEKELPRKFKPEMMEQYPIPTSEIRKIKAGEDWRSLDGELVPNETLTDPPPPALSYAYCTDTAPIKHLHRYFKGVNLLYHEATFTEEHRKRAQETKHSTAKQAAEMALLTESKELILGHFSVRYENLDELLTEAQTLFPKAKLGLEGCKIRLHRNNTRCETLKAY